ncbi:MAG: hypothetical protein ACRDBI_09580 [Shewanella sp.]
MKFPVVPVVVLLLLTCFASAIWAIYVVDRPLRQQTWSSFIYTHGYQSGKYKKTDNFNSYNSCRDATLAQSAFYDNAPWECGQGCQFDSRSQGFHCAAMQNER